MKKSVPEPLSPGEIIHQIPTIPPIGAAIIWQLHRETRQTIRDLARSYRLDRTPRSTIKLHLRRLVRAGYVTQHGRGKATWYTLNFNAAEKGSTP